MRIPNPGGCFFGDGGGTWGTTRIHCFAMFLRALSARILKRFGKLKHAAYP